MSRSLQDQFIDEDEEEEVCPLCVEELDITDRNFRPCPCGYQICQFCYNNIKTTMNGLCPACRRQYKDENIEWKAVSQEEMAQHRQSLAQQAKKKAAAKQKEVQKREAETLSRKHLAGLRVRQKNLVYVTGMKPKLQGDRLIEVLRGPQYFGQYGDIVKIVVANPAKMQQASVGIYITFTRNEDAASCIGVINSSYTDGSLRAQFGTTKYCSAYLRGETCNNRQCMFLHEPGDENERYTRQDLSSLNAGASQQPSSSSKSGPSTAPVQPLPMAAATQDYTDSAISPNDLDPDAPALPATASWANSARRTSRTTVHSGGSPSTVPASVQQSLVEMTDLDFPAIEKEPAREDTAVVPDVPAVAESRSRKHKARKATRTTPLDHVMKLFAADIAFAFSIAQFDDAERLFIETMPQLWDPKAGEKRRELKAREAEEAQRIQQEAQSIVEASLPDTEELAEGGSHALGGEPEEEVEGSMSQSQHLSTIQPPPGHHMGGAMGFGGLMGADLASLGSQRALTPQQHQQLLLQQFRGGGDATAAAAGQHVGSHGRNQSRFNFAESGTTVSKQAQDPADPLKQQSEDAHVYTTAQGPPPGLRATGTPPVSGGGMFGQGHNFTAGLGYGVGAARENDKIWDFHRSGQRGASGANQLADAGKLDLPFLGQVSPAAEAAAIAFQPGNSLPTSRRATPALPPGLPIPPGFERTRTSEIPAKDKEYWNRGSIDQETDTTAGAIAPIGTRAAKTGSPKKASALPKTEQVEKKQIENVAPVKSSVATTTDLSAVEKRKVAKQTGVKPEMKVKDIVPTPMVADVLTQEQTAIESAKTESAKLVQSEPVQEFKQVAPKTDTQPVDIPSADLDLPKRPHPGKLVIPKSILVDDKVGIVDASPLAIKAAENATRASRAPSVTSSSIPSRPATPAAKEVLASPLRRTTAPRTLRITSTATPTVEKPEPMVAPVVTEIPPLKQPVVAGVSKVLSRRPSLSSTAQPGTPVSERLDAFSVASASVSRASSPPALATNKRADKKKAKKQAIQTLESNIEATKPAEDVAPIMARKKKAKKPSSAPAVKPVAVPVAAPPAPEAKPPAVITETRPLKIEPEKFIEEDQPQPVKSVKKEEKKQKTRDQTKLTSPPPSPQPADKERNSTAAAILAALESTEQLALSTLALLKPLTNSKNTAWLLDHAASSSHSHGGGANSADLHNHLQQLTFEITRMEQQLLKQGQAVRKNSGDGRVSGRNLVTPQGERYACLSKEDEDRVLRLEKLIREAKGITVWGGAARSKGSGNVPKSTVRVEGDVLEVARQGLALALGGSAASALNSTGPHTAASKSSKDAASAMADDIFRYINAFVPPQVSDAPLATTDSNGNAVAGFSSITSTSPTPPPPTAALQTNHQTAIDLATGQEVPFDVSAAVNRSLSNLAAATQSANAALEDQLSMQLGQMGLEGMISEGLAGLQGLQGLAGQMSQQVREQKLSVRELERKLAEKKKETEGWEKKLNALIKKNRKLAMPGL